MELIKDDKLDCILQATRSALLVEPSYKRKYVPLGLAKIATRLRQDGRKFSFRRSVAPGPEVDTIYVTSLFTYNYPQVKASLEQAIKFYPKATIVLGGVCASLLKDTITKDFGGSKRFLFQGYSEMLDQYTPDYLTNWFVQDPWDKFSFIITQRGCPNKCGYCAVHRIEPVIWINPYWRGMIQVDKPRVLVCDNNIASSPYEHLEQVVGELVRLDKEVLFDGGLDCKHIDPRKAKLFGQLKYTRSGVRIAFDRIEEDGVFQDAVKMLIANGVGKNNILAYCLFNFVDSPKDADYRMRECLKLGITPYPQQYEKLGETKGRHLYVGKHWTANLAKVFHQYWLNYGAFRNTTFEQYCVMEKLLTAEDWKKWEASPRWKEGQGESCTGQKAPSKKEKT